MIMSKGSYHTDVDDNRLKSYTFDVVKAIRSNDINTLRRILHDGHSFDACNNNGETLLHLACRRSNIETIRFLIEEAGAPTNAVDSLGRTVLHDACWRPTINFEIVDYVLSTVSIETLTSKDCRGHLCFDYCRKEDWKVWNSFIQNNQNILTKLRSSHEADSIDREVASEDEGTKAC